MWMQTQERTLSNWYKTHLLYYDLAIYLFIFSTILFLALSSHSRFIWQLIGGGKLGIKIKSIILIIITDMLSENEYFICALLIYITLIGFLAFACAFSQTTQKFINNKLTGKIWEL